MGSPFTTIEVPPYSFGYFKIPFIADYPPYEKTARAVINCNLYPNPASTDISLYLSNFEIRPNEMLKVQIVTIEGENMLPKYSYKWRKGRNFQLK